METVIDIRLALEQLGTGWQFGGSVTDGTQESWDAVAWDDVRDKPTWADLCTAHEGIVLQNALTAIEAKYAPKIAALREGIMSAYLTDGAIMDENVSGLRTEWASVIAQRNAEMEALLI